MNSVQVWKKSMALWSMRLNAAAALVVAYLVANPTTLSTIVDAMPDGVRRVLAPFVGIAMFVVVGIARLSPQPDAASAVSDAQAKTGA